ncbi:hypothetical protein DSO57_1021940 [Entomophthora muscae]|uniref:Uncharacterized protein n=1 Tax=Entomophthora muscae TaxID=34485 RepID=A0ACC2RHW1_9FUNG|nr:hypothetical protein DSO57_1021940 [Entomophthora muscae]
MNWESHAAMSVFPIWSRKSFEMMFAYEPPSRMTDMECPSTIAIVQGALVSANIEGNVLLGLVPRTAFWGLAKLGANLAEFCP